MYTALNVKKQCNEIIVKKECTTPNVRKAMYTALNVRKAVYTALNVKKSIVHCN